MSTIKNNDDLILWLHLRKICLKHNQFAKAADLLKDILDYIAKDTLTEGEHNGEEKS